MTESECIASFFLINVLLFLFFLEGEGCVCYMFCGHDFVCVHLFHKGEAGLHFVFFSKYDT